MHSLQQKNMLKEKSQNVKGRQPLFYVSFIFIVFFVGFYLPTSSQKKLIAADYDSSLIEESPEQEIKTYYFKDIDNLKEAVIPRMVYFLDSSNYNTHRQLGVKGVLFTFKDNHAQQVSLVSSANGFNPIAMKRNSGGVWYYIMMPQEYAATAPNKKITYKFLSDGIFQNDPTHTNQEDDNAAGVISFYYLSEASLRAQVGAVILAQKTGYGQKVLFRIYRPQASTVSIAGNFNQWNSELDAMKKNESGYFEIEKTLPAGEYVFLFKIDGKNEFVATGEMRYHPVYGMVSALQIH